VGKNAACRSRWLLMPASSDQTLCIKYKMYSADPFSLENVHDTEAEWIILWNKLFHISIGIGGSCYAIKKLCKTARLNILTVRVNNCTSPLPSPAALPIAPQASPIALSPIAASGSSQSAHPHSAGLRRTLQWACREAKAR